MTLRITYVITPYGPSGIDTAWAERRGIREGQFLGQQDFEEYTADMRAVQRGLAEPRGWGLIVVYLGAAAVLCGVIGWAVL